MATTTKKVQTEVPHNTARRQPYSRPRLTAAGIAAYEMAIEELKAKAEAELRKEAVETWQADLSATLDVWLERHPEYAAIDRRDDEQAAKNSAAICHELWSDEGLTEMQRGGRIIRDSQAHKGFRIMPNYWDVEMAAERAKAKGKLVADSGELYKQRCEAVRQQVSLSPNEEDEAYNMDMDKLRRLSTPGAYDPLGPK